MIDFKKLLKIFLVLNIVDMFSTMWFLTLGLEEGNQYIKPLFETNQGYIFAIIIKLVIPLMIVLMNYEFYRKSKVKLYRVIFYIIWCCISIFYVYVVGYNFYGISLQY